jgi:uncharacterized protein (UPF0548 family)
MLRPVARTQMITITKPKAETIRQFLRKRADEGFTYQHVGATTDQPPSGFVVDHTRVSIGEGKQVFAAAKTALQDWRQFQLGWLETLPLKTPIQPGEPIAVVARSLGLWWTNPCRIIYVIDESEANPNQYGFAYGTLRGHVGTGEERFLVEMDETGKVWYDILAFSRPQTILARVGYPYMRHNQRRFGRESSAAMRRAVQRNWEAEAIV